MVVKWVDFKLVQSDLLDSGPPLFDPVGFTDPLTGRPMEAFQSTFLPDTSSGEGGTVKKPSA
jgi:hypothetical protein